MMNCPYILDHSYGILIITVSESGKKLLNLIKLQRPDIDKNLFLRQRSMRIKVLFAN